MANKLAKLEDLQEAVNASTSGIDALLTSLLETAAAMTERIAGVPTGGLRRQTGIIEYPKARDYGSTRLHLACRPIESVSSVKLVYGPGDSDDFAAATALTEDEDFWIASRELGVLEITGDTWRATPRSNLIVYTAGFADPDDAVGGSSIEPPEDVQRGNIAQAVQLFNLRRTAGIKSVDAGGAQGQLGHVAPHPMLVEAAGRYRRML
jgi:hypothetical protein